MESTTPSEGTTEPDEPGTTKAPEADGQTNNQQEGDSHRSSADSASQWDHYAQRHIFRRSQNKILGGVAGGIADYFGVDAWLVRVLFLVTAFAAGPGVVVYIAAYFLIPSEDKLPGGVPLRDLAPNRRNNNLWGWLVLGIAMLLIFDNFFGTDHNGFFPLVLIAFGVYLLRGTPSGSGGGDSLPAGNATASNVIASGVVTPAYGAPGAAEFAPEAKRREPSSVLGGVTVGIALLVTGLVALLGRFDLFDLSARRLFTIPIIVIGLGLIVGAWVGTARWLAILAVLIIPMAAIAGFGEGGFDGHAGDPRYSPASIAELMPHYSNGAGRLVLDLSALPSFEGTRDVEANIGAGELVVVIPRSSRAHIVATAGVGEVNILGGGDSGIDAYTSSLVNPAGNGETVLGLPTPEGAGLLNLNLHAGLGRVYVTNDINDGELTK